MTLTAGTRLGPYEIVAPIGAGGMGEVYRARDTRLDREVAVKVLPDVFAADPGRMARFSREAQVLASLNHPNIAAIYGVEERALVMELVEGPTLAERLALGPIPWEDAAAIAIQIAEALEAAHEKGVVHRDLKPANIKVTPEGRVKVLDFGLAKPLANEPASGGPASSPTLILHGTMLGVILGTAAYMAPEQAKGRAVDRRADIWAFGVVLHEMLTGHNLFHSETVTDTLAAVLKSELVLERVPVLARPIVERCLRRDPRQRWQSIGDVRIAIEEALASPAPVAAPSPRPKRRQRLGWAAAGAISAAAVLSLAYLWLRPQRPIPPPPIQFTVNTPGNGSLPLGTVLRVSPDGESIAFLGVDPADNLSRVYLYSLAKGTIRALPGTERTTDVYWSFDSLSLLLSRSGEFSRMDINANSIQPLPFESGQSSWGPDGVVTATREGLQWFRPEAAGRRLILPAPKSGSVFTAPTLIPGGRWMVYNSFNGIPANGVSVEIAPVDGRNSHQIFTTERNALYAEPGYLLFVRGATLTARAIDPASGKLRGDAHPLIGPVDRPLGSVDAGVFSTSNNGVLAFRRGTAIREDYLVWFDRSGKRLGTVAGVADYSNPALSPDENRLAVGIRDPGTGNRDIWVLDLQRGAASRITFDPADHANPLWSPDGTRIAFTSDRRGARDLYVKNASGIGDDEVLLQSQLPKNAEDWSQDGRWLVYNEAVPINGDDLAFISLDTRVPRDFLRTRFHEDHGRFSPDGKWLAYQSDESGRAEVYIQAFPPSGQKWQISNGGGGQPQWRGDGKELYYSTVTNPARMMGVDIAVKNNAIDAGIPRLLFEVSLAPFGPRNLWLATRDGKRFLTVLPAEQKPVYSFTVVVNWPSLLPKH